MDGNIGMLREHDVFRFTEDGPQHMLTADPEKHRLIAGLLVIHVDNLDEPLTMPDTRVVFDAVHRTAKVPCLLCREDFEVKVDLSYEGLPRVGVCGPCNHKTSVAVIADRY